MQLIAIFILDIKWLIKRRKEHTGSDQVDIRFMCSSASLLCKDSFESFSLCFIYTLLHLWAWTWPTILYEIGKTLCLCMRQLLIWNQCNHQQSLALTSIPVPGPMRVDSLCSAVARAFNVFVFRAVGPSEHFRGWGNIWGLSHLLMSVVPSRVAFGWVFKSLKTQISNVAVILPNNNYTLKITTTIVELKVFNVYDGKSFFCEATGQKYRIVLNILTYCGVLPNI